MGSLTGAIDDTSCSKVVEACQQVYQSGLGCTDASPETHSRARIGLIPEFDPH